MQAIEQTHTKWQVYTDPVHGLVRVRYKLAAPHTPEREYGVQYHNRMTKVESRKGKVLVHWLTHAEYVEKINR